MVILLEKLFILHLQACPVEFQQQFRKSYQQLKAVDKVTELKGVSKVGKNLYKLQIDKSRVALRVHSQTVTIGCFLFNQYYHIG